MNVAVKILKIFAAMTDHRSRECRQRFCGDLDRAGSEKLVVRVHGDIVRRFRRLAQIFFGAPPPGALRRSVLFLLNEADVAAALDVADSDVLEVLGFG